MKTCVKCGNEITGKSEKYCSPKCSRLYLKSVYRKNNKDKLNAYNRERRKMFPTQTNVQSIVWNVPLKAKIPRLEIARCIRCGTQKNLHTHHIRPVSRGGEDTVANTTILCQSCHIEWHKVIPDFYWDKYDSTTPPGS